MCQSCRATENDTLAFASSIGDRSEKQRQASAARGARYYHDHDHDHDSDHDSDHVIGSSSYSSSKHSTPLVETNLVSIDRIRLDSIDSIDSTSTLHSFIAASLLHLSLSRLLSLSQMAELADWTLDSERFVTLLGKLVGEAESLQNQPPRYVPREDNAARHIIELLRPHTREHGGPLTLQHLSFVDGRGNLIIEYQHPSATSRTDVVSFVGSHLDVVYANPANWQRDPFKLSIEGDELHGRGTTDCLGHCALQTDLFLQLAAKRPVLGGLRVVGVLIANEEAGGDGASDVGVEALQKHGHLDSLSTGPVIWLDCANKQPNIGSGGVVGWELTATGVMFHSGFPHKAINAIELATDGMLSINQSFVSYRSIVRDRLVLMHERQLCKRSSETSTKRSPSTRGRASTASSARAP